MTAEPTPALPPAPAAPPALPAPEAAPSPSVPPVAPARAQPAARVVRVRGVQPGLVAAWLLAAVGLTVSVLLW